MGLRRSGRYELVAALQNEVWDPSMDKRAIVINDTSSWYHFGCHLTSCALRELARAKYASVTTLPISEIVRLPPPVAGPECLEPGALARFAEGNPSLVRMLDDSDVVIVNGEGSLHGASRYVYKLFSIIALARRILGKEVQLVNHSVFPNDDDRLCGNRVEATYREIYALASHVAVREPISAALLRESGIDCVDSFDCSVLKVARRCGQRLRKIVFGGVATGKLDSLHHYFSAFERFQRGGWVCSFLHGAPDFPAKDDQRLIAAATERGLAFPVRRVTSAHDFLAELESASLLVSGRFHYTIAAYALGVPSVVLRSNTPKNEALCGVLDLPAPLDWGVPDLEARIVDAALRAREGALPDSAKVEELRGLARRNLP